MTRPRRNVHPDANQPGIVRDLEDAGFHVINVSATFAVGDILVWGYDDHVQGHRWHLIELKTLEGQLTAKQRQFITDYPGAVDLCRTTVDVLRVFGRVR